MLRSWNSELLLERGVNLPHSGSIQAREVLPCQTLPVDCADVSRVDPTLLRHVSRVRNLHYEWVGFLRWLAGDGHDSD